MLEISHLATSLYPLIGYCADEVEWASVLLIILDAYETPSSAADIHTDDTHEWMRNDLYHLNSTI